MSVERRLIRSFGATLLGPAVTILVQFLNVPVMLRAWGPGLYGEWLILTAIPTYLLLTDMGFGNVAGSDMTIRVSASDRDGALETFQSTLALVLLLSLTVALVAGLAIFLLPIATLLRLHHIGPAEARWTLTLLSLNCLVLLQWSVLMAAYRCSGRYASGMLYVNLVRIVEAASFLVLLLGNARPVKLAALMLVVSLVGTAGLLWDHRRAVPWLPLGFRFATSARIRQLTRPAFAFMAFPACAAIGTQGMTIAIGVLAGPVAVALFSPMRTLSRAALQLTDSVKNAAWPELSAAYGRQDWPLARRLHRSAFQISMFMAIAALVFLAVAGPHLFEFWTADRLRFDSTTFDLLLLTVLFNSAWNASSAVPLSANRHETISRLYLLLSVLSLLLAWLLLPRLGLRGAALAMLFTDLGMSFIVLQASLRLLSDSASDFGLSMFDLTRPKALAMRLLKFRTSSAMPAPPTSIASVHTRSIPSLDGLRALSVLAVVLSHFNGWSALPRTGALHFVMTLLGQGGLGVSTFFVISGYLITTLLLNERDRNGQVDLPRFYLRRSLRIFPPYYLYLTVAAGVAWFARRPVPSHALIAAFAYLSNYYPNLWSQPEGAGWYIGHTWSLSVEEQFYLVWPALLLSISGRRAIRSCFTLLCIIPLLRLGTAYAMPIYAMNMQWLRLFHTTIDTLGVGCLLALLMRTPDFRTKAARAFHPVLLATAYLYLGASSAVLVHAPAWYTALFHVSLTSLCIGLLMLYVVLRPATVTGRLLNWAPLRHLGMISYSLYLWQQIFLGPFWTPTTARNLLAAFACAELSYWLVERPTLRLRAPIERWFSSMRRGTLPDQRLATEAKSAV